MKNVAKVLLCTVMAVVIAVPVFAADDAATKKKPNRRNARNTNAVKNLLKKLEEADLNDEQSASLKEIVAEHNPKIRAAQQKLAGTLTADQKTTLADARKKLSAEGKKGKDLTAAAEATLGLSDEATAAREEARKESQAATNAFKLAVAELLNNDQQKIAGLARLARRLRNATN